MSDALVSVIVPTFKRPAMLERTISSVLSQTHQNLEVIVVDDNDADSIFRQETEALMARYKNNEKVIYLKHQINKNGSAARNTGIRFSKGEYIAFLDDDDEFLPQKIALQLRRMETVSDMDAGAVYCNYHRYTGGVLAAKTSHRYEQDEGNLTVDLLLERNEIGAGSTLLIKKSAVEELNGFDESFDRHQDWEFLLRFFKKYKILLCEEYLVKVHSDDRISKKTPAQVVEIKQQYLKKFNKDIALLDETTQNRIYSRHWFVAAECFFLAGDYENGGIYMDKAIEYKGLSLKNTIKLYAYKNKKSNLVNMLIHFRRKFFISR